MKTATSDGKPMPHPHPRPQPRRAPVGFSLLLLLPLALSGACSESKSDVEEIRAQILSGAKAVEDNRMSGVADVLSENYLDEGQRTKGEFKRLVFIVRRQGPVGLFLRDFVIDVDAPQNLVAKGEAPDATSASVEVDVYAVQGKASKKRAIDIIPERARKHEIKLKLVKDDGKWLVTSIAGDRLGVGM